MHRRMASSQKVICPHCNRQSADKLVCTSLGCGKKIDAPVLLFARTRNVPVVRNVERFRIRTHDSGRVQ
jgi:hypothetical protein